MKLGKRLKHIESMVTTGYDHIWDCCCDHGLLGAALLSTQAAPFIHFVDIVPELMQQLKNKLDRFYAQDPASASNSQWRIYCMDVAALPLQKFNGKHLIIIAGVGGDLMSELVKTILQNNPTIDIDFLLCPVHHQFTLRQQLIQLDLNLLNEALIVENQRFYEILLVSSNINNAHSTINPVGEIIWQSNNSEQSKIAADYLHKTLEHYKRMRLNSDSDVQHIIDAYSAVTLQ